MNTLFYENELNKKIFTLSHSCLVYFLDLNLLPLGLGGLFFHDTKHPSMQATQARKFQNVSFIAIFSCVFL